MELLFQKEPQFQARRKHFRVGPAEIGLSDRKVRVHYRGVGGHAAPGKF